MIRDIKSEFFLIKLFSYIDEGKKLKLIRYNKKLQNILEIDLIYYKIFSKRYVYMKTMEKENYLQAIIHLYLKKGIQKEKKMEKEKNMIFMNQYYLMENI